MKLKSSLNVLNILNDRVGNMAQLLRVKHVSLVSITHIKCFATSSNFNSKVFNVF